MVKSIRIYCEASIELFQPISLPMSGVHYLVNVMRRKKGDRVIIFDGKVGEFEAILITASKTGDSQASTKVSKPSKAWRYLDSIHTIKKR